MTSSKHDYVNCDQFAPNCGIAIKTIQRVSVPNLNVFGQMETELRAKEFGGFSIMLYGEVGWVGTLLPTNMAAPSLNIVKTEFMIIGTPDSISKIDRDSSGIPMHDSGCQ